MAYIQRGLKGLGDINNESNLAMDLLRGVLQPSLNKFPPNYDRVAQGDTQFIIDSMASHMAGRTQQQTSEWIARADYLFWAIVNRYDLQGGGYKFNGTLQNLAGWIARDTWSVRCTNVLKPIIKKVWNDLLLRDPEGQQVYDDWYGKFVDENSFRAAIAESQEAKDVVTLKGQIDARFISFTGRSPTTIEMDTWAKNIKSGASTIAQLEEFLRATVEYIARQEAARLEAARLEALRVAAAARLEAERATKLAAERAEKLKLAEASFSWMLKNKWFWGICAAGVGLYYWTTKRRK